MRTRHRWLSGRHVAGVFGLAALLAVAPSQAQSMDKASQASVYGTMSILAAPLVSTTSEGGPSGGVALSAIGGAYIVSGVFELGQGSVEVVLDAVKGAGKLSVKVAKSAVATAETSVGTAVQVSTEATGTLLVASGKVLAFIPNTVGEALLYHSRVPGASTAQ